MLMIVAMATPAIARAEITKKTSAFEGEPSFMKGMHTQSVFPIEKINAGMPKNTADHLIARINARLTNIANLIKYEQAKALTFRQEAFEQCRRLLGLV